MFDNNNTKKYNQAKKQQLDALFPGNASRHVICYRYYILLLYILSITNCLMNADSQRKVFGYLAGKNHRRDVVECYVDILCLKIGRRESRLVDFVIVLQKFIFSFSIL